jgi:hypothetical protein
MIRAVDQHARREKALDRVRMNRGCAAQGRSGRRKVAAAARGIPYDLHRESERQPDAVFFAEQPHALILGREKMRRFDGITPTEQQHPVRLERVMEEIQHGMPYFGPQVT